MLGLLAVVWAGTGTADPLPQSETAGGLQQTLAECRSQRQTQPAEGVALCERLAGTAVDAGDFDVGFEALLHAADAASGSGDSTRAELSLQHAEALLDKVQDPLARQRLARRRGMVAYHGGRIAGALQHFLEGLAAARLVGDESAIALSDNDLGVVYRRLGEYSLALSHFESSLSAKQRLGVTDVGATLANIGNLYRELGDHGPAEDFLRRALDAYEDAGRELQQAHTIEDLGLLAAAAGNTAAARGHLQAAWERFRAAGARPDLVRLAAHRAELEANAGAAAESARWLQESRSIAESLGQPAPLHAGVISARLVESGEAQAADTLRELEAGLANESRTDDPSMVVRAHDAAAQLFEARGELEAALAHTRDARRRSEELEQARHGERFDALRVRFDLTEVERQRDQLGARNAIAEALLRRRQFQMLGIAALGLVGLAVLALFFQRRLFRQRLDFELTRVDLMQRIRDARRNANALRSDVRSLEWLLDEQQSASLVFDAAGRIRAVTRSAARWLGIDQEQLREARLSNLIGEQQAAWAQQVVEQVALDSDARRNARTIMQLADGPHPVACRVLDLEEELGVLMLDPAAADTRDVERVLLALDQRNSDAARRPEASENVPQLPQSIDDADPDDDADGGDLRERLVALMQTSLEIWERCKRTGRIELAEASGVWRVTVDDGRLRTRAMDRYLSLETIPERPRWREVLRTAYYVLAECEMDAERRIRLETDIEEVRELTKQR